MFLHVSVFLFFLGYGDTRYLHVRPHSFPTRLSSDLAARPGRQSEIDRHRQLVDAAHALRDLAEIIAHGGPVFFVGHVVHAGAPHHIASVDLGRVASAQRSEEHTSELQSLMRISYAVFCLKKKKKRLTSNHAYV